MSRAFLEIQHGNQEPFRLIFELFWEQVPKTAENFIELCRRESNGYIGSCFHRVIQDFVCQGGDYTKGDGTGGLSIYGGTFEDEDLTYRKHDQDCLLSMANKGPDTNGSQFFITSQPLPHLDGKHVVFGRLVSGQEDFRKMEAIETNEKDEPIEPLRIVNAGELRRKKVVDTVQDEDLVVPVEKVESPPPMEESDQEGEEEVNPYVIGVAPPPEVEAPSNFLLRDDRSRYSKPLYSRVDKDADGRKVKGRGSVKYGNSSRYRDDRYRDSERYRRDDRYRDDNRYRDREYRQREDRYERKASPRR